MSFDQDPNEQAQISGADLAMMVDEMKRLTVDLAEARRVIVELEDRGRNFYAFVEGESPSLLEDDHNAYGFHFALDDAREFLARTPSTQPEGELPEFEDARVQIVYKLLCNEPEGKPDDEHWEGWIARHIVAALRSQPAPKADDAQGAEGGA